MKQYEAMFVLKPDLDKTGIEKILNQIQELVTRYKGAISETKEMAKNRLAYQIKKQKEGVYYLINFNIGDGLKPSPTDAISAIKKSLALNEAILRMLIIEV